MSEFRLRGKGWAGAAVLTAFSLLLFCSRVSAAPASAGDFISSPNAEGAPAFHHHLVRPGSVTTYIIRVAGVWDGPMDVRLTLSGSDSSYWSARLSDDHLSGIAPGERREVILEVRPALSLKEGRTGRIEVSATAGDGSVDKLVVEAETTRSRKIYFVSIDSLHPAYLKLNAAGTGRGREGDWLMPNAHRLMKRAMFYPEANVHLIAATDMNHFNYLAGTKTGTAGISSVSIFFYGFDEQGKPILKGPDDEGFGVARYGRQGQQVKTLFNVAKEMNPQAWTAFVSGKNWVPEMMKAPQFDLDRIIHGRKTTDYIEPVDPNPAGNNLKLFRMMRALLPGPLPPYAKDLGNPEGLPGPLDKRLSTGVISRVMSVLPSDFPPDEWTMDAAIKELQEEDPDVFYVLLGAVDDAGHAFGSAFELNEWDDNGTPADLTDDVSKYDARASRQGILNVVREADIQLGRFLDLLEARGTLDDSILVVESDHSMVTYYRKAIDLKGYVQKNCELSLDKDYYLGSAVSVAFVTRRRDDPDIILQVERVIENMKVKNPLTGKMECPLICFNREEMKTGIDQKTGKNWMLPDEYYSEYYSEHRSPGEQVWPDLLVLTAPHYKFTVANIGLGNIGMAKVPFTLPEFGYFIGGHGSFATRPGMLMIAVPDMITGVNDARVYTMDVAPTIYRLQGWPIPKCVDGKGLPGVDPTL